MRGSAIVMFLTRRQDFEFRIAESNSTALGLRANHSERHGRFRGCRQSAEQTRSLGTGSQVGYDPD